MDAILACRVWVPREFQPGGSLVDGTSSNFQNKKFQIGFVASSCNFQNKKFQVVYIQVGILVGQTTRPTLQLTHVHQIVVLLGTDHQ